ncbi:hypothetical protein BGW42_000286 [Actinomortierella wolfii]|nr:hypothetical protein BGW42_000286 [Actinomortierella wolfii]
MPTKANDLPASYEPSATTTSSLLFSSSVAHNKSVPLAVATGNILQSTVDHPTKQQSQQYQQLTQEQQEPGSSHMTDDHAMGDTTAIVVVGNSLASAPLPSKLTAPSLSLDATTQPSAKECRQSDLGAATDGSQSTDIPDQQLSGEPSAPSARSDDVNGSQQVPQSVSTRERDHDDDENVSDVAHDDNDNDEPRTHTAVFRPQLDDIMLDQDLLDFYQRLKELVSRSPLKTAQVLYAFAAATSHLEVDLMKPSIFNMFHKTFSFYQDNTWFTVDLEPYLEDQLSHNLDLESNSRVHILPTRHKLIPAPKAWSDAHSDRHSSSSTSYSSYLDSLYSYSPSHLHSSSHKSKKRRPSRERSPSRYSRYDDYERAEHDGRRRGRERERDRDDRRRSHRYSSISPSQHREGEISSKRTRTDSTNDDGYSNYEADALSRHSRYLSADGRPLSYEERRRLKKKLKKRWREEAERAAAEAAAAAAATGGAGAGGSSQAPAQSYANREATMANGDASQSASYAGSQAAGDSVNNGQQYPASQATRPLKLIVRPPTQQPPGRGDLGSQTPQTPVAPGQGAPRTILPNDSAPEAGAMRPPSTTPAPKPDIPLSPHQIRRKGKHIGSAYSLSSLVPLPEDAAARNHKPGAPPEEKLKKGTWTSQEEEMLLEAVRELSSENWHAVAARVPGRNAKQCMQKWQTDLDPQINRLPWTIEEDQRLVEAYQAYGNSWQQIAKVVETRTWYQCYNRVRAKSVKSRIMNAANFAAGGGAAGSGAGAGTGAPGSGPGDSANVASNGSRGSRPKDTTGGHNRGANNALPLANSRAPPTAPAATGSRDTDEVIVVKQEDGDVKPAVTGVPGPNSTTPNTPSTKVMPTSIQGSSVPGSSPSTTSTSSMNSNATTPTASAHSQFAGSNGQGVGPGRAPLPLQHQQQPPQRSDRNPPPLHSSGQHQHPQAQKANMDHGSRPVYTMSNQPGQGGPVNNSPTQPMGATRMNQGQHSPMQPQQQHPYQQQHHQQQQQQQHHPQQQQQQQQQYRGQASSTPHSPHLQHAQQQGQRLPHTQGPLPQSHHQQQRSLPHQSPQLPQRSSHEMSRPTPPPSHTGPGSQTPHSQQQQHPQQQQQQGSQGYHGQGQGYGHSHSHTGVTSSPHQGYQPNQPPGQLPPNQSGRGGGPQHSPYQQHQIAQASPRQQPAQNPPHQQHQQQQQQPQPQQSQPVAAHHRHNSSQGSAVSQQPQSSYLPTATPNQLGQAQRPGPLQQAHVQQRTSSSFQPPPPISTTLGSAGSPSASTTPRSSAPSNAAPGGSFASQHRSSAMGPTMASPGVMSASPTTSMAAGSSPSVGAPASSSSSSSASSASTNDGSKATASTTPFSIAMPSPSLSGLPPQLSPGALAFVPTSQLLKMTKSMQSPSATGFPPSSLPLRSPVSTQPPRPLPSSSSQQQQQQQQPGQGHQQQQQQPTTQGLNPYFQGHGRDHQGRAQ